MPLPLNPEMIALAYDYLCCTPPFNKWNLPHSEEVKFTIIKKKDRYAHYQMIGGVHHIAMSSQFVGRHELLLSTLAHELIHLHCEMACMSSSNPHDAAFHKLADRVCRIHEFDRLIF
jgi:hypothetical protein